MNLWLLNVAMATLVPILTPRLPPIPSQASSDHVTSLLRLRPKIQGVKFYESKSDLKLDTSTREDSMDLTIEDHASDEIPTLQIHEGTAKASDGRSIHCDIRVVS